MPSVRGIVRRVRGDHIVALTSEVAALREIVLQMNHEMVQMKSTIDQLNHDVRAGGERSLPLFLGYAERLRLDADTAIGATQVIERQLALLDDKIAAMGEPPAAP